MSFRTGFVPESGFFPSFAIGRRADEILVFPGRLDIPLTANTMWAPAGLPLGLYGLVLDVPVGAVRIMPMKTFSSLDVDREPFARKFGRKFRGIDFAGADVGMAAVYARNGVELIAVGSAESSAVEKTSFGIPSLIPFMGRQKIFETRLMYSGTLYLEIFDTARPQEPLVRLQQRFENHPDPPVFLLAPEWVQGAGAPLLVFVGGRTRSETDEQTIFLLDCSVQRERK